MSKPTNNVSRLATIAKMMEDGNWYSSAKVVLAAADEIERLRAERDEARREICESVAAHAPSVNAKQWAQERGWDCFKEDGK
jgi:hypothetical protein